MRMLLISSLESEKHSNKKRLLVFKKLDYVCLCDAKVGLLIIVFFKVPHEQSQRQQFLRYNTRKLSNEVNSNNSAPIVLQ